MNDTNDIATLRAYLLDRLPERESEEVELALIEDERTYELLLAVEEELIDDYVRNVLTRPEASSFLAYLGRLADGPARARFAHALSSSSLSDRSAAATTTSPAPRRFAGSIRLPAAVASLLVVSVVSGTVIWHLSQRVWELEARLGAAGAETHPSFLLRAGVLRGEGSMQEVIIADGDQIVELRLDLAEDSHERYRATLRDVDGVELASSSRLRAQASPDQVVVSFLVPARTFSPGDYYVELEAHGPSDERETIGRFDFRAVARYAR